VAEAGKGNYDEGASCWDELTSKEQADISFRLADDLSGTVQQTELLSQRMSNSMGMT
jgi:hypothetical protein